jgi:hypothetical protein
MIWVSSGVMKPVSPVPDRVIFADFSPHEVGAAFGRETRERRRLWYGRRDSNPHGFLHPQDFKFRADRFAKRHGFELF